MSVRISYNLGKIIEIVLKLSGLFSCPELKGHMTKQENIYV